MLHITLKTGEELNLKELVDLGSKDNILRELDKLKGIEYSYYRDKQSHEFTDLNELMNDENYAEEDIKITGIFKGVHMYVEDNSIKLHTSFTKNTKECDIKIDGMNITSKNGKKLIKKWDLKSNGFDTPYRDYEFDKRYSSYKINVDFDKDLEQLSYISIEKD